MKIRSLEVKEPKEIKITVYECAYCTKRFLNKGSYYNHIKGNYCTGYFIDFEEKTRDYKNNKIGADEYYEWCYEKGYLYTFIEISKEEKDKISNKVFEKICKLYED